MPFYPELLYQLSARDQQVTWLDPILDAASTAAAAVNPTASFLVPEGRCLVLQAAVVKGSPGAGQNITRMFLSIQTLVGTASRDLKFDDTDRAADFRVALDWQGSILIPPGWRLHGSVQFNAGVQVNTTELNTYGLLIPIGNIQRV